MKIAILAVATANLDDVNLVLENQTWDLKDIMPICTNVQILSAVAGDATWVVYVSIPMTVTNVGSAAGVGTYRTLTDSDPTYVSNLQATTIARFEKGRSYLIRAIDGPVTNMIPQPYSVPAAINTGVATGVYSSRRYLYQAAHSGPLLGALTIDVITFDLDLMTQARVLQQKQIGRTQERIETSMANASSGQTLVPAVTNTPQLNTRSYANDDPTMRRQ